MPPRPSAPTEVLRQAIERDPRSCYAIGKAADVEQSTLSRFRAGSTISSATFDRLCDVLDLRLVPHRRLKQPTKIP